MMYSYIYANVTHSPKAQNLIVTGTCCCHQGLGSVEAQKNKNKPEHKAQGSAGRGEVQLPLRIYSNIHSFHMGLAYII